MALLNDTKHDRFCKSVTEIKDHAKNFPNAPRITLALFHIVKYSTLLGVYILFNYRTFVINYVF